MAERALLVAAVLVLLTLDVFAARALLALRNRRVLAQLRESEAPAGGPRLVYFTTTSCMICRYQQEPGARGVAARTAGGGCRAA